MKYVKCPADKVLLRDPITEALTETASWAMFVRALFCEQSVLRAISVLDLVDLRKGLMTLQTGQSYSLTEEHWGVLAAACRAPTVFAPVWIYSAPEFFRAFIEASSQKSADVVAEA